MSTFSDFVYLMKNTLKSSKKEQQFLFFRKIIFLRVTQNTLNCAFMSPLEDSIISYCQNSKPKEFAVLRLFTSKTFPNSCSLYITFGSGYGKYPAAYIDLLCYSICVRLGLLTLEYFIYTIAHHCSNLRTKYEGHWTRTI